MKFLLFTLLCSISLAQGMAARYSPTKKFDQASLVALIQKEKEKLASSLAIIKGNMSPLSADIAQRKIWFSQNVAKQTLLARIRAMEKLLGNITTGMPLEKIDAHFKKYKKEITKPLQQKPIEDSDVMTPFMPGSPTRRVASASDVAPSSPLDEMIRSLSAPQILREPTTHLETLHEATENVPTPSPLDGGTFGNLFKA